MLRDFPDSIWAWNVMICSTHQEALRVICVSHGSPLEKSEEGKKKLCSPVRSSSAWSLVHSSDFNCRA